MSFPKDLEKKVCIIREMPFLRGKTNCEILPLGDISEFPLQLASAVLEKTFDLETIVRDSRSLPKQAFNPTRGQYNAPTLLSYLRDTKRSQYAFSLIAKDLYAKDLNFVFGQAAPGTVAILSLYRLSRGGNVKERIKKEVIHEMGHVIGLSHCSNRNCVMSFSNSLLEVDAKGERLCEQCKEKVRAFLR